MKVFFRFPVPDLRPVHSLERIPWWKKNLRDETLVIEMTEVTLSNVWNSDAKESKYELQCKDAHGKGFTTWKPILWQPVLTELLYFQYQDYFKWIRRNQPFLLPEYQWTLELIKILLNMDLIGPGSL